MAQPSIQSGSARHDLNPVSLLQPAGSGGGSDATGFEAALDRARQPESGRKPSADKDLGRRDEAQEMRTAEQPERGEVRPENPQRPDRPAEGRPENASGSPEKRADGAEQAAPPEQAASAKPGEEDAQAAAPAALPADIAAIIAAFIAARSASDGPAGEDESIELPGLRGNKLALGISDLLGGASNKDGSDTSRLATLLGGKDAHTSIGLDARDKSAAQALNLAAQANNRPSGGAEALLSATARSDANMGGVQTAAMPFAARLDGAQAAQSTIVQLPVATTVGHRGWAAEVGNQVAWMLGRNESRAELQLTPPSLGKLGVSIQVNGDQTTAHFVAATQATRDALEQAMPRLREVLQQAGINLGQTSVGTSGQQSGQDGSGESRRGFGSGRGDGGSALPIGEVPAQWIRAGNGVIDTFA